MNHLENIKALLLDLDGVITQTATIHSLAWKKMFDDYNQQLKSEGKEAFEPMDIKKDYAEYLDGIPRYEGVDNFLKSREIELPWGSPADEPGYNSVCALGNLKNGFFQEALQEQEVEVYDDALQMLKKWKQADIPMGIISSSKNCRPILESAGLTGYFDIIIDGVYLEENSLDGKPAPDIFLEAAEKLGMKPEQCAVFEDAISGVKAGSSGDFKLVIGVDRVGAADELKNNGADLVVQKLTQLA